MKKIAVEKRCEYLFLITVDTIANQGEQEA